VHDLSHPSAKCPLGLGAIADQIAVLAGIADKQRAPLRSRIAKLIDSLNHRRASRLSEDDRREVMRLAGQWVARQKRVLKARRAVREAATELCAAIEDYDQAYGKEFRIDEVAPAEIDRPLRDVLAWLNQDPPIAKHLINHRRRRGRTLGRIDHPDTVSFLMLLVVTVRLFGGNLRFDKNHPDKSTLIKALDLLRPYVPPVDYTAARQSTRTVLRALSLANEGPEAWERFWAKANPNSSPNILAKGFFDYAGMVLSGTKNRAAKRQK
jgi:hypothetical protein